MLVQHANTLRDICRRIASTACGRPQAPFSQVSSKWKLAKIGLQGEYPPDPLLHQNYKLLCKHFYHFHAEKHVCRKRHIPITFIMKGTNQIMENRDRQNRLTLRLNDDEKYVLEKKWKISGMKSKSSFIRHLILYGYVYDVNYNHLQEYNTNLSRISNSLNQIAKRMNATGNVYEADVKEVKELMKQVWQSQKSMLSKQPSIKQ